MIRIAVDPQYKTYPIAFPKALVSSPVYNICRLFIIISLCLLLNIQSWKLVFHHGVL